MKYSFNLGSITVPVTKPVSLYNPTPEKETIVIEKVSVDLDISVAEMAEQFSQYKEVITLIKESYLFIKEEINSQEATILKENIIRLSKAGNNIPE